MTGLFYPSFTVPSALLGLVGVASAQPNTSLIFFHFLVYSALLAGLYLHSGQLAREIDNPHRAR